MAVKCASLLGSKSGYGIAGEVVGLEGNVAVVVDSLNSLYLALVVDEPDRDTVNVLTLFKLVGESDGDKVVLEVGDKSVFTLNGEVIYRVITDLLKLFLGKTEIKLIITGNLIGGYGYFLVTDKILDTLVKIEVGVLTYLKLIVKVGTGYLITGGDHLNGLGFLTAGTGVGGDTVSGNAVVPLVTKCGIDLDSLGLYGATAVTGESLHTVLGTGCGSGDSGSPFNVADDGFGFYNLAASVTSILLNLLTGVAHCIFNYRINTGFVTERASYLFIGLFTASRACIVVYLTCGTACGSRALNHAVVTGCRSKLLRTGGTYLIGSTGRCRAGSMSVCRNILSFGLSASTTSSLNACGGTSCGSGYGIIAEAVSGRSNALGLSSVTVITGIGLNAGFGTTGKSGDLTVVPVVTERCAVLTLTDGADCGLKTGCRTSLAALGVEQTVTDLGSVTYATGSGMYAVYGLIFTKGVAYSSLTLEGVIYVSVSTNGAGVVIGSSSYTVATLRDVGGVGVLCAVIVSGGSAVALTAYVTYCKRGTGGVTAGVTNRCALSQATVLTALCLGTGCICPRVAKRCGVFLHTGATYSALSTGCSTTLMGAGLAVRHIADFTFCRTLTGRCATLMSECLTLSLATDIAVLCLSTAGIYPIVRAKLTVGLRTDLTYCLIGTVSSAALMSECRAVGSTTYGTDLRIGTGCIIPSVICQGAVALVTTITGRKGFAGSVSALMSELLAVGSTAYGTVLRLGTGCVGPAMVGLLAILCVTTVTNCRGFAICASAYVAKLLAVNKTAHGAVLGFGTGCLCPLVLGACAINLLTTLTFRSGATGSANMTKRFAGLGAAEVTRLRFGTGCF